MADMLDTLKGLLGDNADEKLSNIMNIIGSSNSSESHSSPPPEQSAESAIPDISPELFIQAQQLMKKIKNSGNDERSCLLRALKPFMRKERQSTIDDAIRFLGISQIFRGGL